MFTVMQDEDLNNESFEDLCLGLHYQMIQLASHTTLKQKKKQKKVFILDWSVTAIIPLWQTDLIQTELVMQGDVTSRRQHWFAGLTESSLT